MAISKKIYKQAFKMMYRVRQLAVQMDEHAISTDFVHSFPSGHEAIQVAAGIFLKPKDHLFPYYRDTALIHAAGFDLRTQLQQLFSSAKDYFSNGTSYFNHISYRGDEHPNVILQSASTGMQAIPAVGLAHGLTYLQEQGLKEKDDSVVLVSMGEGALSSGEVAEAIQMAVFMELPVVFLIQDNEWVISAKSSETVSAVTPEFYKGVKGLHFDRVDGRDLHRCCQRMEHVYDRCRKDRKPAIVFANVSLLGHHTSKVKKETYREADELSDAQIKSDPIAHGLDQLRRWKAEVWAAKQMEAIEEEVFALIKEVEREDVTFDALPPYLADAYVTKETGDRSPKGGEVVHMAEAASRTIFRLMESHPEAIYLGQDIGKRLGGVFRESYNLAGTFGNERVLNMSIQEAYTVGCTSGLSAAGCKPIAFIQFADYFMLGMNQLYSEISKSFFLTGGKWPVSSLIRIPYGHYKGAGPYHATSIESILANVHGIKIICPSNAADMAGLLRAAFLDPNPVIALEHKGLYWSGDTLTAGAKQVLPEKAYQVPIGKAAIAQEADSALLAKGSTALVVTYGMGVHWAIAAGRELGGAIEVLDLRSLVPVDYARIAERLALHGKCMVLSEEGGSSTFAHSLAGKIQEDNFRSLDAPIAILGSQAVPGIPINPSMEEMVLPNVNKVRDRLKELLEY